MYDERNLNHNGDQLSTEWLVGSKEVVDALGVTGGWGTEDGGAEEA
jgi:hypothetical protein